MGKNIIQRTWRKIDNTAKAFTMEENKYINTFRLSVVLKRKIDPKILKQAINKTLDMYPSYKVKMKSGFFWNYLKINKSSPIVEKEKNKFIQSINLGKNNDYLFKVTYASNKINLDICHILTDGIGATIFFKGIIYNYLNLKYNLITNKEEIISDNCSYQDQLIQNADKKLLCEEKSKKAFLIRDKSNIFNNKTYHYIIDLNKFKETCKKNKVTISEYLSALYIYAIYRTIYNKESNKDISLTIPVDLRRHYNVNSFSNFFTCMNIKGNVLKEKYMNFKKILAEVKKEFKNKLTLDNIQKYLSRDVKLGTNFGIGIVPLFIKKPFMRTFGDLFNQSATTTLSNIGQIKIAEQYKKYIDNIVALVSTGKIQKVKCTVCSYENNLTITINSSLKNNKLEKEFYKLLVEHIGKVRLESNIA